MSIRKCLIEGSKFLQLYDYKYIPIKNILSIVLREKTIKIETSGNAPTTKEVHTISFQNKNDAINEFNKLNDNHLPDYTYYD